MSKKILASIMTFIIFATTLCKVPVFAAITYLDADGVTQSVDNATQITSELTTWTGWVYATGDVTIEPRVQISGDVHLILSDNCSLTCNKGIRVVETNSFTIYAQSIGETKGSLNSITNHPASAAIGGDVNESNGSITINGGKINADATHGGDGFGAGIGGGIYGNASNITINGGDITAIAQDGAGIGSGGDDTKNGVVIAENITINDGKITATSNRGAAIGSGRNSNTNNITINNGEITATSTLTGAAIGSGQNSSVNNIKIENGIIEASAYGGAGIGSGYRFSGINTSQSVVVKSKQLPHIEEQE